MPKSYPIVLLVTGRDGVDSTYPIMSINNLMDKLGLFIRFGLDLSQIYVVETQPLCTLNSLTEIDPELFVTKDSLYLTPVYMPVKLTIAKCKELFNNDPRGLLLESLETTPNLYEFLNKYQGDLINYLDNSEDFILYMTSRNSQKIIDIDGCISPMSCVTESVFNYMLDTAGEKFNKDFRQVLESFIKSAKH